MPAPRVPMDPTMAKHWPGCEKLHVQCAIVLLRDVLQAVLAGEPMARGNAEIILATTKGWTETNVGPQKRRLTNPRR